jgi:outer membrane scaffolding protein for murein synthesis (MipA/OmpV family)
MDVACLAVNRHHSAVRRRLATFMLAGIAAALLPGIAAAGEYPLWELGAGATVLRLPDYRGSDESRWYVYPIPYFVYRGEKLRVERASARGLFFRSERVELDVSVNATPPVDSSKNAARRGMPDLDPTIEIGPSLVFKLYENPTSGTRTSLQLPVRTVIATDLGDFKHAGWVFNPRINTDLVLGTQWRLGIVAGPIFATRRYHEYFYSVGSAFQTPERPAFTAGGGYSGTQATLALSRRFDKTWVGAFVRADNLSATAFENSPLLRSRNTFLAGVAVSWIFAESGKRVEADD